MPVMRYQIRNEYGLADPDLYGAADPDDPEALLEGVAMAGLVGVLRQLGDLAEFAAEIFHGLHEEVMGTAARGHGLMLRVQQLEAEFPSIEKAFLSQTNYSHLAYIEGTRWHANIQSDHNLITRGDMPRFVLDSYEECRGPPRLFMLDKFDVAGAGACLKRYSDPSFFKTELASSGIVEAYIQKEKKARKIKKKLPRWRNEKVVDTSLSPYVKSNLQPESFGQVPEKTPTRRVKLKSRHLNDINTSSRRSYMESLLKLPSPEEKVLQENSKRQPKERIESGESVPEVHEIFIDNYDNFPSFREGNHTQSPSKQITLLDTNERENQNINSEEFFETIHEALNKVENHSSISQIVEEKEMLVNSLNKKEDIIYSQRSSEAEKNAPVLKDVHQKKVLAEVECITEGFTDGYRSDDIGSEVENYADALNIMDSELETDSESRAKSDLGFFSMDSQRVLSDSNRRQSQSSETYSFQDSTATFRLKNSLNKEIPWHSNHCSITAALSPLQDMINFDSPANSEHCMSETHNNTPEDIERNIEAESIRLLSDGSCSAIASDVPYFLPAIGEAHSGSCLTDSISSPIHIHPQGSFDEVKSTTSDSSEIPSYVKSDRRVAENLDDNLPCMTNTYVASEFDGLFLGIGDFPGTIHPAERISEYTANIIEMPYNVSQEHDERVPEQCSAGHVEDVLFQEQESMKQDAETCSNTSLSPITCAIIPNIRSMLQPDGLATETEYLVQPEDLDAEISLESERISEEVSKKLDGLSFTGQVPEKSHLTENKELEDKADELHIFDHLPLTQKRIILENIPAGCIKDSPMSLTVVNVAEPELWAKQNTVACSGESISPTTPANSPLAHHISVHPTGVDEEMESFLPSGEELSCSGSAENIENSDDIISGKIIFHDILPVELELLSNEEPRDNCNVESEECVPLSAGKNRYPDNIQLQSSCESTDVTHPVSDNFGLPSGLPLSGFHQVALHIDQPMQFVDSSTHNVSTDTVVDYDGTSAHFPDDADPIQHSLDTIKASSPTIATVFHSESTMYKSLIPQDENLHLSAPAATSSDINIVNLFDSSRDILSNGVCHSVSSEHAERDTNPTIDEDSQIYSIASEQDLSAEAFQLCTQEIVEQDTSSFIHPAMPNEEFSKVQPDDEPNMISSDQEGQLLVKSDLQSEIAQSVKQDSTQNNCVACDKQSEPGSEREVNVMTSDGNICDLDLPPTSTGILWQLDVEASVPSECNSVDTVNSLAPNISTTTAGLPFFADFGPVVTESTLHQFCEPSISSCEVPSLQQDVQEAPPLPPLPPLGWRMRKLRLGSLVSDGNSIQPMSGTHLLSKSNMDKIYAHGLVTAKEEMLQQSSVYKPLPSLEERKFRNPLLSLENKRLQPLKLSELPPIVDSKGYHNGNEREMGYPLYPSSLISSIEDSQHVHSHNAFWGETFQPSNPFAPSELCKDEDTRGYHQGDKIQPLEDMRPELGQLLPAFELERYRHGNSNIERNFVQSIDPLLVEPHAIGEKYQFNFRVCEVENLQHLNLSEPISTRDPRTRQHDFMSSGEKYPYIPDDGVLPTMEDVKPDGKFPSIRNLPRHPLIDAVAAHDKTKLRKVSELVQRSTKPKAVERDTLLEQIRNKSFNLKPASAIKPNINGPRTNLKVTAILEKANAIRQACVGSDEDDDVDNWSDS